MVVISDSLDQLSAQELRELLASLMTKVAQQDQQIAKLDQTISIDAKELVYRQTKIDQLTHEMAVLKRHRFGRSREQLDSTQASLLEEAFDEDLAAIGQELKNLTPPPKADTQPPKKPKRTALPADLPRVDVHHEPDSTACQCGCQLKRIGEDVSEKQIARIYDIERETKGLPPDERQRIRQEKSKPLLDALQQWMILNRQKIMDGSATAKALDYSLRRWGALTRFVGNGQLPIDNNHIENQIRPIAIGRGNWLFAGSLRAGQRAAAVMSLIQSAKLNGHDPYASLKDVLTRLPTQRNSMIGELLPHRWTPPTASP